jgi:outer membrane protein assembly factor BamD
MFLKRYITFLFLASALLLGACQGYQKVLKSSDLEYKLQYGIKLYEAGRYAKALPLFDELLTLYRGTSKAQDVFYYLAMTQFQLEYYQVAAYHFKTFYQTFPNHAFADESAFMVGFCYYKESPPYSLDQANTYKAINELQLYINTHPNSSHIEECNMIIDEMRGKLEKKSFFIAKQYWHTSNYKAAVESLNGTLNDFPDTPYREEAMFLRLDATYQLATNSVVSLQPQRYKEAQTSYYDLIYRFPDTKYRKDAEKIFIKIETELDLIKQSTLNKNS